MLLKGIIVHAENGGNKVRLIDADALPLERYGEEVISWYATGWNDAIDAINRAQTVDAEPVRHGEWKYIKTPRGVSVKCSECRKFPPCFMADYCPNCGAKMDGGKHENT